MLPKNATIVSHKLARIAQKIADNAPENVSEIILDGSVARGLSDKFSDIELQFFSDDVPSMNEILAWMASMNFYGEPLIRADDSGFRFVNDTYDDVRVELAWTSFTYEATQLDGIIDQIGGSQFINAPYKWSDAIALRGGTHIIQWKALFNHYPDSVRNRYIQPVLDSWRIALKDPIDSLGRWKDAHRNAWFYLLKTHWMDVLPLLRIIFAYNRMWFPVAKWWHTEVSKLRYKPKNLVERVNNSLSNPDPIIRIDELSRLQIEVVQLIEDDYVVDDVLVRLREVREYGLSLGV